MRYEPARRAISVDASHNPRGCVVMFRLNGDVIDRRRERAIFQNIRCLGAHHQYQLKALVFLPRHPPEISIRLNCTGNLRPDDNSRRVTIGFEGRDQ
jgi:hypothetical protein